MSDTESQAIARLEAVSMEAGGVQLKSMQDARTFCKLYHQSGMAPRSLNTPEKLFVALQTGAELGLKPGQAMRGLYVVGQSPALKGDCALGLIQSKGVLDGGYQIGNEGEGPERHGFFEFKRHGWDKPVRVTFSSAEAKRAGLSTGSGQGWKLYPDDMLVWRAVSRASKRYFSDVTMGLDIAEVVREYKQPDGSTLQVAEREAPKGVDPLLADLAAADDLPPIPDDVKPEEPSDHEEQGRLL